MMKKILGIVFFISHIIVFFSARAAVNCDYDTAVANGFLRTITITNQTNNTLQFNSWSPTGANPGMAWGPHNFKQIHSLTQGSIDLGICCNDHKETMIPLQLVYNLREGAKVTQCTINLTLSCAPQIKLLQADQGCDEGNVFLKPINTHQVGFSYLVTH